MAEDRYPYLKIPEEYYYEFYSEGPKGNIKKIVRYSLIQEKPYKIYNLGFGDWDETENDVDDMVNTNNQDRQRVLATVADTVMDFLKNHPKASVFAKGSTKSRTRLYQMNIAAFWDEISDASFIVKGYLNKVWQPFQKGINFEAFIIRKKI
jgi:hypothetical protein